jgi:N-acetylglucosaminyl-diphospho-decaprenol L-rhamnosyltransferase
MADCGIVVVTYNSAGQIGPCLDAALQTGADIVVVDNASTDATVAEVARRGVRLIANATNRGFAGAVNQGVTSLDTPYILLLNPDAIMRTGLQALRDACDLPGSAGAGGLLLHPDGRPQVGFMVRSLPTPAALALEVLVLNRLFSWNWVNRRYRGLGLDYSAQIAVEQPAGAFLMIRRSVWRELGGFDEGFHPVWFEDVDFCRRAVDRGYSWYFSPRAVASHSGGHSIPQLSVEMRRFYWYRSLLRYAARHFRPVTFRALGLAVVTGSILRGVGESAWRRSLQPLLDYRNVVRLAGRCLLHGWGDEPVEAGPQSSEKADV